MPELALEFIFRIFIYVVVILAVIGLILNFRQIAAGIRLPCFWWCKPEEKCETFVVGESAIDENVLKKYCDLCWSKTGEIGYKKDCLCYVIKGPQSSPSLTHPNCKFKCLTPSSTFFVQYKFLENNITVEC